VDIFQNDAADEDKCRSHGIICKLAAFPKAALKPKKDSEIQLRPHAQGPHCWTLNIEEQCTSDDIMTLADQTRGEKKNI